MIDPHYQDTEFAVGMALILVAVVSFFSTVITLYLIYDMKKWNGYLLVLSSLTCAQLLLDLQFFLVPFYYIQAVELVTLFMNVLSSVSVSLWINYISILLYRIVTDLRSYSINEVYHIVACVITFTAAGFACAMTALSSENGAHSRAFAVSNYAFLGLKLVSIIFNLVVHFKISFRLKEMGFWGKNRPKNDPVLVLSSRIKYYPIIQIIAMVGSILYEFQFGFDPDSYHDNRSTWRTFCLFLYGVTYPSAGTGYFVVFLCFQPNAYKHLKMRMKQLSNYYFMCCCGQYEIEPVENNVLGVGAANEPRASSITTYSVSGERTESLLLTDPNDHYMEGLDEEELIREIEQKYMLNNQGGGGGGGGEGLGGSMGAGFDNSNLTADSSTFSDSMRGSIVARY